MDGAGGVSRNWGAAEGRSLIISFTDRANDAHSMTVQRRQNVHYVPSL